MKQILTLMPWRTLTLLGVLGATLAMGSEEALSAATITVNSAADSGDGVCDAAECTLREAIGVANFNPGKDTIAFAIPGVGPHTIQPSHKLPNITDSVVLDATTQPGYTGAPLIELDGSLAVNCVSDPIPVCYGPPSGFTFFAGDSVVRGFAIGNFEQSGIYMPFVGGNVIQSNYIGTDVTGLLAAPNGTGVFVADSSNNVIGGDSVTEGNLISGNLREGVFVFADSTNNRIAGNLIGTDVAGAAALGNQTGVAISYSWDNLVGGTAEGEGNVIAGNEVGVEITGETSTGNLIQGNLIGTDVTGVSAVGNSSHGVSIDSGASANTVGGTLVGEGNVIAHNGGDGVRVDAATSTRNNIRGNSIHSNQGKGIENLNGGNTELTPPTVTSTGSASGTSSCLGCVVDVFSDDLDEGETYEGSTTTDGSGDWSFAGAVTGPNVTATVTDGSGNTSEFSLPISCLDSDTDGVCDSSDPCPTNSDCDGDGISDAFEVFCGTDALDPSPLIPERLDNAFAGVDDDGDLDVDEALPSPGSDAFDCDGDGFTGTVEMAVFQQGSTVDDQYRCAETATANDEADDRWPADFDDNKTIDIIDVLALKPVFGTPSVRHDLDASGRNVNIIDVLALKPVFNKSCT